MIMSRQILGRYIVADDAICHGNPTFRGTRILVADVLQMLAPGQDWYSIREARDGTIAREAILEAADLARQAFMEHLDEYVVETVPSRIFWTKILPGRSANFC